MNRKSPSIHASENEIGKISTGNDKNNWIILEKNKIKRWYLLGKYKIMVLKNIKLLLVIKIFIFFQIMRFN